MFTPVKTTSLVPLLPISAILDIIFFIESDLLLPLASGIVQ